MKLEYLEQFINLAESLNYQNTADYSFISQSTLSKHVFKLENEFKCKLIDRSNRRSVKLTNQGKILYNHSKVLLKDYYSLVQQIKNNNEKYTIKIAFSHTMVEYGILEFIQKSSTKNSKIQFKIKELNDTNNLASLFIDDQVDIAFIQESNPLNSQLIKNVYSDNLVAIIPSKNKLNNLNLFRHPSLNLIVPLQLSSFIGQFEKQVINHGDQPVKNIKFTPNIIKNIIELSNNNVGAAILPKKQADFYLKTTQKIITLKPNIKVFINAYINPKYKNNVSYKKTYIYKFINELKI